MTRARMLAAVVLVVEVFLYIQYAQLDGEFHYWLHGLIGAAVGLAVLTAARLLLRHHDRDATHLSPWVAAGLGHLYSAAPDVLFLTNGVLHDYWMDAFAFHITAHFTPAPIPLALVVFLLALTGYGLSISRRPRVRPAGAAALGAATIVASLALINAAPIPDDIQDLRANPLLAWHHTSDQGPHPPMTNSRQRLAGCTPHNPC